MQAAGSAAGTDTGVAAVAWGLGVAAGLEERRGEEGSWYCMKPGNEVQHHSARTSAATAFV